MCGFVVIFFFKQKTAYEMRISDWSSNVCSSDLLTALVPITNQLIRRASMNVQMMIRDDLVEGVAVKEDQQFLRGVGSATAPTGLRNLIAAGNVIPANAVDRKSVV